MQCQKLVFKLVFGRIQSTDIKEVKNVQKPSMNPTSPKKSKPVQLIKKPSKTQKK